MREKKGEILYKSIVLVSLAYNRFLVRNTKMRAQAFEANFETKQQHLSNNLSVGPLFCNLLSPHLACEIKMKWREAFKTKRKEETNLKCKLLHNTSYRECEKHCPVLA